MKKIQSIFLSIIISILCIYLAFAFECQKKMSDDRIPCDVVIPYPIDCMITHAEIFFLNNSIENITSLDYYIGNGYCSFTFTYKEIGTYFYTISNGDTGSITIGDENMIAIIILGFLTGLLLNVLGIVKQKGFILCIGSLILLFMGFAIQDYQLIMTLITYVYSSLCLIISVLLMVEGKP